MSVFIRRAPPAYDQNDQSALRADIEAYAQRNVNRDQAGNVTILGKLGVGAAPSLDTAPPHIADFYGNVNEFLLARLTNANSGGSAAAEWQAYNDTPLHGAWGILGSGVTGLGNPYNPNTVYFYAQSGTEMAFIKGGTNDMRWWISNTEHMRLSNGGPLYLICGQLKFPSTQAASSDANTLDDYEEGTFTPTLGDGTNNYTLSTANGAYTKIGRMVTASVHCVWTSIGSAGAGQLELGTMPFVAANTGTRYGFAFSDFSGVDTTASAVQITGALVGDGSDNIIRFSKINDNAGSSSVAANSSSASGSLGGQIVYFAT